MRLTLAAAFAAFFALPAAADQVSGTVASFDIATGRLVMTDRSVWLLGAAAPAALAPGQGVTILFQTAGDSGVAKIVGVAVR